MLQAIAQRQNFLCFAARSSFKFFTHKSLQQHAESVSNERLAELGHQILRMAITYTLFHHKEPVLDVERMIAHRKDLLGDDSIEHWVNIYGLRRKVRCLPAAFASLDTPQERRFLFCTYVGAVCVQDGIQAVQTWIEQLIRPDGNRSDREKTLEADSEGSQGELLMPPAKRIKIEPGYINTSQGQIVAPVLSPRLSSLPRFSNLASNPSTPSSTATQLPLVHELQEADLPPPVLTSTIQVPVSMAPVLQKRLFTAENGRASPPCMDISPSLPPPAIRRDAPPHIPRALPAHLPTHTPLNPFAPAQAKVAFLPTFNQMASQRKVDVKYTFESYGPPHSCRWRVACHANGILKGTGDGLTKQNAKEQAARQAYFAMGWAPNLT